MSMRILIGSLIAAAVMAGTDAAAGEFVQIESGAPAEPVRLTGYLARPQGAGPFSAVILLHGCGGFHSSMISWADRLSRYGYAALAIDSFGARGMDDHCGGFFFDEQATDGYAALRYLTVKPFVRPSQIALMGFSMGGGSVLAALEKGLMEQRYPEKFRAGIAFYPVCQYASGITTGPVLVLVGDKDDWTPSASCEAMAAGRSELGAPRMPGDRSSIELVVYPGVHHDFDQLDLFLAPGRGITIKGHRAQFNEDAMRDSIVRVRDFLQRTIGGQ
ncbi:MAG TPA: dienelactone hydrolase family protein [Gemmatimonadales bacterium]|nr:dienelactone hydrolase family protein [Gemmatimonadales bacterium]